jgi:hypothetical protein
MQLLQTGVCTHEPRLPPVELGVEGQTSTNGSARSARRQ